MVYLRTGQGARSIPDIYDGSDPDYSLPNPDNHAIVPFTGLWLASMTFSYSQFQKWTAFNQQGGGSVILVDKAFHQAQGGPGEAAFQWNAKKSLSSKTFVLDERVQMVHNLDANAFIFTLTTPFWAEEGDAVVPLTGMREYEAGEHVLLDYMQIQLAQMSPEKVPGAPGGLPSASPTTPA